MTVGDDTPLAAAQVAAALPPRRAGRPTKSQTVRTWMRPIDDGGGLCGVQLKSICVAGTFFTSRTWVEEFHRRVAEAKARARQARRAAGSRTARQAAQQRAREKLEALGQR